MSEGPGAPAEQTAAAGGGQPPRKKMPLLMRLLLGGAGVAALIAGGAQVLGAMSPSLPDCGDQDIQASIRERVSATAGSQVTAMANTRTVSRTDTAGQCTVHMTFADGRQTDINYSLTLNGRTVNWEARNLPIALPACDSQNVQDLARRILQEQNNVTASAFTNIRTLGRTPQEASCQMDADFGPRGTAQLRYSVRFTDATHFQVQIAPTALTPPAGAAAAAPDPRYAPQPYEGPGGGYEQAPAPEGGGKDGY